MSPTVTRIDAKFASARSRQEKILTLFLTAGFPHLNSTPALVLELEKAGADIIELGMPFSDPLADGPVIQQSSEAALKNGVTLQTIFSDVRKIRESSEIPIVLMGYLNPILAYGSEIFFSDAHRAGVDGIILPEVPKEEVGRFSSVITKNELANIMLVSPGTSSQRVEEIDSLSSGFLYCVSTNGVTGVDAKNPPEEYLKRVKLHSRRNPVLVGFGISTSKTARSISKHTDGIIVGTALIKRIARGSDRRLRDWVAEFKNVLR